MGNAVRGTIGIPPATEGSLDGSFCARSLLLCLGKSRALIVDPAEQVAIALMRGMRAAGRV